MRALIITGDRFSTKAWAGAIGAAIDDRYWVQDRIGKVIVITSGGGGIASLAEDIAEHDIRCRALSLSPVELTDDRSYQAHNSAMLAIGKALADRGAVLEVLAFHTRIERSTHTRDLVNQAIAAGVIANLIVSPHSGERRLDEPIPSIAEVRASNGQMAFVLDAADKPRVRRSRTGFILAGAN